MKAIVVEQPGGPDVMRLADVPEPVVADDDVLINVAAAGVNRADVLQRLGFYPPPAGASPILGLEVSGTVLATGDAVSRWREGDRVMALLAGGGYAQRVSVPQAQVIAVPESLGLIDAAGVPEVFITAHDALRTRGRLADGETVLIHGGSGGVGTAAIQLAAHWRCRVAVTAGGVERLQRCAELGATLLIDHRTQDFVAEVHRFTDGRGVDVILDVIGAQYLGRNVEALAQDGRLVSIGTQGGTHAELDLGQLMRRRGALIATTLRARPLAQKAEIVARFVEDVLPLLDRGAVHPVIGAVFPLARADAAHRALEAGTHVGKIVLDVAS